MTLNVLQETSNQKYVMNLVKQKNDMYENIYISCKRLKEVSIYSFSGQSKYEDFFHNQDIKRCQRTQTGRYPIVYPSRRQYGWVEIGEPFVILLGGGPSKPNKGNTIIDAFKVLNLTVSEEQTLQGYIARAKMADRIFSSVGNFKIFPDENNKKKVAEQSRAAPGFAWVC